MKVQVYKGITWYVLGEEDIIYDLVDVCEEAPKVDKAARKMVPLMYFGDCSFQVKTDRIKFHP